MASPLPEPLAVQWIRTLVGLAGAALAIVVIGWLFFALTTRGRDPLERAAERAISDRFGDAPATLVIVHRDRGAAACGSVEGHRFVYRNEILAVDGETSLFPPLYAAWCAGP